MNAERRLALRLAAGLILLRLLLPETAAGVKSILISERGRAAVEAFYRTGSAQSEAVPVFGGLWDDG